MKETADRCVTPELSTDALSLSASMQTQTTPTRGGQYIPPGLYATAPLCPAPDCGNATCEKVHKENIALRAQVRMLTEELKDTQYNCDGLSEQSALTI
ncbi:hypothetical protein KIPB_014001, partial [Kipferlia bialata]|eukprot:g14001.t1